MRKIETNDWLILNNIIYLIYTTEDFDVMRKELIGQLKMIIDFDSADFYMSSMKEGELLCNPVNYNCDVDLSAEYEKAQYLRGIMLSGKMLVYRETDILSEETDKEYFQKVYKPNNFSYALRIVIAKDKKFLGTMTFYKTIGKEDFQYDDIFMLDILKDHLAYRMEQNSKEIEDSSCKYRIKDAVKEFGLTAREETVLRLLLQGKNNELICEELSITTNTLKKHILNIYRKLGIKNRVQLFKMIKENE